MKRKLILIITAALTTWGIQAGVNPQVREVDMDIEYLLPKDDPDETAPGGFIGVGQKRKIILRQLIPSTWTGPVELRWTNPDKVKVTDAVTGALVPQGQPFTSLPKELFVEGLVVSGAQGDVRFILQEPPTGPYDWIAFTILKVELFRDGACTKVLDDWPAAAGQLRSPKYIFGKDDGIYIRVTGPAGKGNNFFKARVASESDVLAPPIALHESPAGSGKYVNKKTDTSPVLQLGPKTALWLGSYDIKVIDEEVLSFTIVAGGSDTTCTTNVMVDRGEFATATARSYDSRVPPPPGYDISADRTPIWRVAADEFVVDINDSWEGNLSWWEVGNVRGSTNGNNVAFTAFVKNGGENQPNNLQADLVYTHSHGSPNGNLGGTKPTVADPTIEEGETILNASVDLADVWDKDVDWAIIKACSILRHTATGRSQWEKALKNGRRAHGILSFEDPSSSNYGGYVDDFLDEIGARHTIITAWVNANTSYWCENQPYAIVYHTENAGDLFQKAVEGVSLTADVTSDNFSYIWRDRSGGTGTDSFPGNLDVQVKTKGIPKESFNVSARTSRFDIMRLKNAHSFVKEWQSGYTRATSELRLDSEPLSVDVSRRVLSNYFAATMLPVDVVLGDPIPLRLSDDKGERIIAFIFVGNRETNGITIFGDEMRFIVQSDGVKAFSGWWHDLDIKRSGKSLSVFRDADLATCKKWREGRRERTEKAVRISNAKPVYYLSPGHSKDGQQAVLHWRVSFEDGSELLYDPEKAMVVDLGSEYNKLKKEIR